MEQKEWFPIEVRIENTNNCNAHCVMCPREKMCREKGFMSFELFKKIVDQCAELDVKMIHVHGYGEPLLDPLIFKKIKYIKEKGIPETYMVTNGSLLNEEKARKLIESGLDAMNISFYGFTKETYEKIHRHLTFETTKENVKNFFRIRKEMGKQTPKTHLTFLACEDNENEKQSFLDFWKDIADDLRVSHLHNFGDGREYRPVEKDIKRISCGPILFLHAMQILWDGTIAPCCFDTDGKIQLGNADKQTLMEIWDGKAFTEFRKNMKEGKFEKYPLCDNCEQLDPRLRIKRRFKWQRDNNGNAIRGDWK
jgi:radical SAM protein with 4Fe4S-binding SPASM domain